MGKQTQSERATSSSVGVSTGVVSKIAARAGLDWDAVGKIECDDALEAAQDGGRLLVQHRPASPAARSLIHAKVH